jgi:predicted RNA-binding protein associated with RNAse of E/G family
MSESVKITYYDLAHKTNTVKMGCFLVDVYEADTQWLYMARKTVDHPYIAYIKAFLIPRLGLQINQWQLHQAGVPPEYSFYDFYIDIGAIEVGRNEWVLRDFYLDVLVVEGKAAHILDTDEYLYAVKSGFLSHDEAHFALTRTHELINALAENGYSLESYFKSKGIDLPWPYLR